MLLFKLGINMYLVTQDGLNYGFGAIKTSVCHSVWWKPKAVIGSHGDKKMAKIVQKIDSI
jgi:hypothetical protein